MASKIRSIFVLAFLIYVACGFTTLSKQQYGNGEHLFNNNCSRCHGKSGTKGFLGAKDLKVSVLSDSGIARQILNGKGFMPSFKGTFKKEELQLLVRYVKSLRAR